MSSYAVPVSAGLANQAAQEGGKFPDLPPGEIGHEAIVGESEPVLKMLALAEKVAVTDSVVLITGETGTGKELLAQWIHGLSRRNRKPMCTVNCAALTATLIESELFGHEKGAYTGALTLHVGRFEAADGSTLFLDEIGDLPLELQTKLLRVLEEGSFERLGSSRPLRVDVRIIAATNRDLADLVKEGRFRADLFYRLNVFPITAPPVRERRGDIAPLVWHFVRLFSRKMGKSIDTIPRNTMDLLEQHDWPGNIRELRNVVERAVIESDKPVLNVASLVAGHANTSSRDTLEEAERRHIVQVLNRTGWRVSGNGGAAELLGLKPTTLRSKLKKLSVSRPGR